MSTRTQNLNLFKPELTDISDITAMNENWDKIDSTFEELSNELNAPVNAAGVSYDNSNSTLTSKNVQAALTETVNKVDALSAKAVTTNQVGLTLSVDSNGILTITY